jgi:hypothetical protein
MKTANVIEVFMNDDNPYELSSILVNIKNGGSNHSIQRKAIPLNPTSYAVPIVGEQVYVIRAESSNSSLGNSGDGQYYYINSLASHCNLNINIFPDLHAIGPSNIGNDYDQVSLGVPNVSSGLSNKPKLGEGFSENDTVQPIQPFVGDVIHQGRFGQSIRFGYTPITINSSKKPTWKSADAKAPITIIRNGGEDSTYNKFTIEDINDDDSSIWLGSKQTIGLKPSNGFSLGVIPQNVYNKPQLVFNSDRVVINSKSDSVLISGAKSVNISTPSWKADMDVMFNQIEALKNQIQAINNALIPLASGLTAIPLTTAVGTPLTNATARITTELVKITTQLQLMKQ